MRLFPAWFVALASMLLLSGTAYAQNAVTLNLKDAEIGTLINTVSEVTGRNFIVDPRVKARVTVVSATPMSPDAVYETFLSVLQVYGFAAVPAGDVIKIVPEANVRQDGGAGPGDGAQLPADEVVTRVMAIRNVPAAQLVPILRPLVPQWGHLAAYAPSNMLIIADRAANIGRLERIIRDIDRGGDTEVEIVRLEHASAAEVVRILSELARGGQQEGQQPGTVIADERSNAVLIGGDPSERQRIRSVIDSLDVPLEDDGATQVIYLRYASAENLAPILEGFAENGSSGGGGGEGREGRRAGSSATQARIVAEPDTNSLVITAGPKAMRTLRHVIQQLDIRRAQVMVETLIAEISHSQSVQLGLDWAIFNEDRIAAAGIFDPTTGQVISGLGQTRTGTGTTRRIDATALAGLLGQGVTAAAGRFDSDGTSFAVLIHALQGDGDTNILSAPTLLTMDNEEAEFSVGQEVPFLTGQFTSQQAQPGVVNPFQTIERRDVGLTMNITPTINEGDTIKLKLALEVSSLGAALAGDLNQITNRRTLTNTVTVDDGQVLILGGLIDDNTTDSRSGVPFLSQIPVIGALFRFQSVSSEKRNLMLFLRPRILRDRETADFYTRRKYEQTQRAQVAAGDRVPLIRRQAPRLQDFELFLDDDDETLRLPLGTDIDVEEVDPMDLDNWREVPTHP